MAKTKAKENVRGFSVVELCILLGMVVFVSALAIPSMSSAMRSMQLAADARSIASALSYAKLSAVSQMTRYRVSFDLNNKSWNVEKFNRSSGSFESDHMGSSLSNGVAASGISFKTTSGAGLAGYPSTSSSSITFNSRGMPVDNGGVPTSNNVIYVSKDDADFAISVSLAGKVQVWKYRESQWCSQ